MLPAYGEPGRALLEHERVRELYPRYLAAGAYATLVMVPLMEAALERARALAPTDEVARGLSSYLERHIPEELHGDEPGQAMLADLAAVGVDTAALRSGRLPPAVAELIGTQYFWIQQSHPVTILGFLWLEAYPPYTEDVERLIDRTGLSRDGFRQLLLHSELDVRHREELREVIDSLPLEPWHEELIGLSALTTISLLVEVWLDVIDD